MTVGSHSSWRRTKGQCPLSASQDGVCGCPQFWVRKDSPATTPNHTPASAQNNAKTQPGAASTSRPELENRDKQSVQTSCETGKFAGPPQETCFFWYHGTCHRGSGCNFAHESHITWPIAPPPGYVHYEPCDLPLCPLRQDLAVRMEDPRRGRPVWRSRLDGQLDGAAASYFSRDESSEATSTGTDSANPGDEAHDDNMDVDAASMQSLIDPNSRPLDWSYSDSDPEPSEVGKSEEGDDVTNAEQQQNNNDLDPSTAQFDDMDYFDLSGCKPLPPSSDVDSPILLSLSHPGTLGKRSSDSISSPNRKDTECKRPKVEPKHGSLQTVSLPHDKTAISPNSAPNGDRNQQRYPNRETESNANAMRTTNGYTPTHRFLTGPLHHLPPKPESPASGHLFTNMQQPTPPRSQTGIPTGPRALGGGAPVCFYWYHKGHCNPKRRRDGQLIKCNYAHTLEGPHSQVSLPPNITDHDPSCPLPLCPVPRTQPLPTSSYSPNLSTGASRKEADRRWDQSRKDKAASARHGSRPRETMLGRHVVTRDRDVSGNRNIQKPLPLSGANSESVRVRKNAHQKGRKHKGNDLGGDNRHREGSNVKTVKRVMKKYAPMGETYGRLKKEDPVLDYGDVAPQDMQASVSTNQVENGSVDDGHLSFLDQLGEELSRPGWMNMVQPVENGLSEHTNGMQGKGGASLQMHGDSGIDKSVDREPSVSEDRLDWDTDEVRRMFGEIV